jgi:hypothetical protein
LHLRQALPERLRRKGKCAKVAASMSDRVRVSYLELTSDPAATPAYHGPERIALEKLDLEEYLWL